MPHWRDFHSGWFMQTTEVPGYATVAIGVPGFDGHFAQNNGDFRIHISINDFGLRNSEPISSADNNVWVIGDSMAFGWGVEEQEMYSSRLAALSGQAVYNVASPGTSVCGYQALAARMPSDVKPSAVIVGLVLENDVSRYNCKKDATRVVSKSSSTESFGFTYFKRFLSQRLALYNFAAVTLKKIPLVEKALKFLGLAAEEHLYRQYISEDEMAIAVQETVDELSHLKQAMPMEAPFAVMIAPARFEIKDSSPFYRMLREEVKEALKQKDIAVIDPIAGFFEKGFSATHFAHDGHWTALGHDIAARAIAEWLSMQYH